MERELISELTKWFYFESNMDVMTMDKFIDMNDSLRYDIYCYTSNIIIGKKSIDMLYAKLSETKNISIIEKAFNLLITKTDNYILYVYLKNTADFIKKEHMYVFDKISITESNDIILENNDILPIPTHLKEILIPIKKEPLNIFGNIKCICGCVHFKVMYTEQDYGYVKCICDSCNNEYLIFDSRKHGWDGYVCKGFSQVIETTKLRNYLCEECNSHIFHVNVTIFSQGRADFCRELKNEIAEGLFSQNEWVEAFERINISLTCTKCKKEILDFVDYETM